MGPRGEGSRWGCQSVELLPTVPPPGDITWLGELPCAGPSVCLCHIPFVMLTIGDSHNNGLLLLLFLVFFLGFFTDVLELGKSSIHSWTGRNSFWVSVCVHVREGLHACRASYRDQWSVSAIPAIYSNIACFYSVSHFPLGFHKALLLCVSVSISVAITHFGYFFSFYPSDRLLLILPSLSFSAHPHTRRPPTSLTF